MLYISILIALIQMLWIVTFKSLLARLELEPVPTVVSEIMLNTV